MSIPKEPRQQMINIMYLALTALLALNVSSEVLNVFKLINDKLSVSNAAVEVKSASLMNLFEAKFKSNETKTQPYIEDANKVRVLVNEFYSYVDGLKARIVDESGGVENGKIKNASNTDVTTRIMIEQKNGPDLEQKLGDLKNNLLSLPMLKDHADLQEQISLDAEYDKIEAEKLGKKSWSNYNFERVPVIAAITLLSKLQADAKEAEARILERLYGSVDLNSYIFEDVSAKVISPNSYILTNRQDYRAQVFFAATSKTLDVEVFVGKFKSEMEMLDANGNLKNQVFDFPLEEGYKKLDVKDGIADYAELPTATGKQARDGVIKIRKPDGTGFNYFPFEINYHSAQPGVVISPDNINVLYAGVENPLSISVPGFPAEKVKAYLTGDGLLRGANGTYTARMNHSGTAMISVNVINDEGKEMKMKEMQFRVKRVPDPDAVVNGQAGGAIEAHKFRIAKKLDVVMKDFLFTVEFKVLTYKITWQRKNEDLMEVVCTSAEFSQRALQFVQEARPGDVYYFENIKIRDPAEENRQIQDIAFRIR